MRRLGTCSPLNSAAMAVGVERVVPVAFSEERVLPGQLALPSRPEAPSHGC